ncbi:MAG: thiamine pyrophosphate-dependent dehydrogenase E1 component subunit alpha [Actinobacteria bacterium]|nr:thiamine pyrophosphate-dependent dehydrogenase E1 component subunit alpha [Actinomycetota bacterium]MCL5071922.1 thiamine pyrophosphate-dependent dehydrogenase E1 component subunit alpha [Actinomycetota bacterium]
MNINLKKVMVNKDLNKKKLLSLYEVMIKIRYFEEKILDLFLQGKLPGTLHLYNGQEAISAGVCSNLRNDDYIIGTHRPHGCCIAKGVSINSIMAEIFGKKTGCCKGKGGSMHIGDINVGAVTSIAIVGAGIPIACGLGLACKLKGNDNVTVTFFGDGASNEGAFHEALNLAAIKNLPVIFVCENNLYGYSTHISKAMKIKNISQRASSYGIQGFTVNGNDVIAVYESAKEAIDRARKGNGPTLLEYKTYRILGHSRSDPGKYRSAEEVKMWISRDPIKLYRSQLLMDNIFESMEIDIIEKKVKKEIDEAVLFAEISPNPSPIDLYEHVYYETEGKN